MVMERLRRLQQTETQEERNVIRVPRARRKPSPRSPQRRRLRLLRSIGTNARPSSTRCWRARPIVTGNAPILRKRVLISHEKYLCDAFMAREKKKEAEEQELQYLYDSAHDQLAKIFETTALDVDLIWL